MTSITLVYTILLLCFITGYYSITAFDCRELIQSKVKTTFLSLPRFLSRPRVRLFATAASRATRRIPMTTTDLDLPSFFHKHIHPYLHSSEAKRIHLFFGNQAADADSIVSALSLAFASFVQYHSEIHEEDHAPVFIPIVQIQPDDLALRQEVSLLLGRLGLQLHDLVTASQLLASSLLANSIGGDITLLDHNVFDSVLQAQLNPDKFPIVQIVDHHADSSQHLHVTSTQRYIAFDTHTNQALAGSCCTLVYEQIQQRFTAKDEIISKLAWTLLGVILLDTVNLDPAAKRVTKQDSDAAYGLMKVLSIVKDDCNVFFDEIANAKSDLKFWRELSSAQCFRFDYKLFKATIASSSLQSTCSLCAPGVTINIGISAVLLPAVEFLQKKDAVEAADAYMAMLGLDSLLVMTFVTQPAPARDIIVFSKHAGMVQVILQCFEASQQDDKTALNLSQSIATEEDRHRFAAKGIYVDAFHQGMISASRKQVAPLLTTYLEQK